MAVPPPPTPLIQATVDQLLFLNANGFDLGHVNTLLRLTVQHYTSY